jgi:hypothetical protein
MLKATRTRLIFIVKAEHDIDDWHAIFDGDALEGISNGATQVLRVIGFALQNHSARNDRVRFVSDRKFSNDHGNLERARNALKRNRTVRRKCPQFLEYVIYEPIHVLRIKPARNDVERAFDFVD